jgi:hypothetical protein
VAELTEDCCFNDPRDQCIGPQCVCGCHDKQPRVTRREWESITIADFGRLEAENERLNALLAANPPGWTALIDERDRLHQALCDIQFDLINCPEAAGSRSCEHLKDAIRIAKETLA